MAGRPKLDWKEELQDDKGKEIAWLFFREPLTIIEASRKLFPEDHKKRDSKYTDKTLRNRFYTFKRREYLEIPRERLKREGEGKRYSFKDHYILNLNFLFDYAKEKEVDFNDFERGVLKFLFYPIETRKHAYKLFLGKNKKHFEDIIGGVLNYYFSIFIWYGIFFKKYKDNLEELKKIKRVYDYELEWLRRTFVPYPSEIKELKQESRKLGKNEKFQNIDNLPTKHISRKRKMVSSFQKNKRVYFNSSLLYYEEFHEVFSKEMRELDAKIMNLLGLYPKLGFSRR